MTNKDEQTINAIVDAVTAGVTAAAPLAGAFAPEVLGGMAAIRAIVGFVEQMGHGDAIKELLDAELAAGRQKVDEALAAKVYPR